MALKIRVRGGGKTYLLPFPLLAATPPPLGKKSNKGEIGACSGLEQTFCKEMHLKIYKLQTSLEGLS